MSSTPPPPVDPTPLAAAPHEEPLPEGDEPPPRGTRVMAAVRWALVALMALAAVASVLYYFNGLRHVPSGAGASARSQYYCPMHPSVVSDEPGECPICSMTLVPKPPDGHAAAPGEAHASEVTTPRAAEVPGLAPVDLELGRIQLMGMRTAPVERGKLSSSLRTVGVVAPNEKGLAQIQTRFAGWIEELLVSETGQHVSRGEALATIFSPELLSAQQELLSALKWASAPGGQGELAADSRKRLELLGIAQEEIDELVRSGRPQRALKIRSPVSGVVISKAALKGLYVQPGTELFQIADLSTLWVLADVYEHDVARVSVGMDARLKLAAFPRELKGKVQFIYPTVDSASRTLRLRVVFNNPGNTLRPGMYGDVLLELPARDALLVPTEAVVDTGEVQYLFVAHEHGHFEPRRITLGDRSGDKVQVLTGVADGETVVTTANFLLDSESRLKAAIGTGTASKPAGASGEAESSCERDFDRVRYPAGYQQCRACEVQHRGMGTMEEDCKSAIARPWK